MKKRPIIFFILVMILTLISLTNTYAHPYSQEGILAKSYIAEYENSYIGGDYVGWSIDEGYHTNGSTMTYSFSKTDPYLTDTYESYVTNGALKWSGTVSIQNKTDGSGTGLVKTFNNPNTVTVAQLTYYSNDADSMGHFTSWTLEMNRSKTITAATVAHELGHAIGLNDLYADFSSNKLMYGYDTGSATTATAADKWGAKVITGLHTSHSWGYKYYSTNSMGNVHIKYCTECNGFSTTTELCTYNQYNVCTKCGTPYGIQPYSIGNERE